MYNGRATIRDIAASTGVSMSTVSRVINETGEVRPALRNRVVDAVQALGYSPSRAARSLRSRRTQSIRLPLTNPSIPFYSVISTPSSPWRSRT